MSKKLSTTLRNALGLGTLALASLTGASGAVAQESAIRKALAERIPQLTKIDEITKTAMPGLYEVRFNETDILYADAEGNFLIQGKLIDTKTRRDLTEERMEKLTAVDFGALPAKDAFTIVRGNGKRHLAVFEDPNCGYCKRFEKELATIKDITVHMYLFPILGPDSGEKSKTIWCAKDKAKAWQDWMVREVPPAGANNCDTTALTRNVEFGKKYKITGTPTLIFSDGVRMPGAISAQKIEQQLAESSTK